MPLSILESARIEPANGAGVGGHILLRLWRHRNGRVALVAIALLAAAAVVGPMLTPYGPNTPLDMAHGGDLAPSWAHPLGTDQESRDLLSRMLSGARVSLSVAALAVLLSATIGATYGMVAGYLGGFTDGVLMRLLDAFLAIPRILTVITLVTLLATAPGSPVSSAGPISTRAVILIIGVTGWFGVSRLIRAETLTAKHREYVLAARALGASGRRIIVAHLLPNVIGPLIVAATLGIANVIAIEAALSFLGYGVRIPQASWGSILQDALGDSGGSRWMAFVAGTAIVATVLAFNVLGDALREVVDARQLGPSARG